MARRQGCRVVAATALQRQHAFSAALYAEHPRPRLLEVRAVGRTIRAKLAMPDGSVREVIATTADQAEFDALADRERSRIRSAFLALAQTEAQAND